MASAKFALSLIPVTLAVSFLLIQAASVFAQDAPFINRVEVWGLFYRLMVIAFTVGAVLMGILAYVVFRFRESNPKNVPRDQMERHH
jgi:heme/copper-type cytochrome/quinol oxidase subunit 2